MNRVRALLLVFLGVLAFSFTLPMTRYALGRVDGQSGGFDPLVVGFGRTAVAGIFGVLTLTLTRSWRVSRDTVGPLLFVALGNGIGFGALISLALKSSTASHGAIVIAGLPIATAIFSVIRNRERPSRAFWAASLFGTAVVMAVTLAHSHGTFSASDILLLLAVGLGALGYAEGGALAGRMSGTVVIAWGLVLSTPIALIVSAIAVQTTTNTPDAKAWLGFLYVATFSMFIGFLPFYRGLAEAGVTRASQVQLVQPILTVVWGWWLLGEPVGWSTFAAALAVLACVLVTQRARVASVRTPALTR